MPSITHLMIEKITATGDASDYQDALKLCLNQGYTVTGQRLHDGKFAIWGERVVHSNDKDSQNREESKCN
jgi:hypothetical protein